MEKVLKQIIEGGELYSAITSNWFDLSENQKNDVFLFFRQATANEIGYARYQKVCNETTMFLVDNIVEDAFEDNITEYEIKLLKELDETEEHNNSEYSEGKITEEELLRRNTKAKAEVLLKTRWL